MSIPRPHFLLFSDSITEPNPPARRSRSRPGEGRAAWRFILEAVDGEDKLEVEEDEPGAAGDRLDLLAVVRGLEALDQPSRVTLVTSSRYVARGFRQGLEEWRENGWQWERFGQMVPVRNGDLWRRIDRAMAFHRVDCHTLGRRSEEEQGSPQAPVAAAAATRTERPARPPQRRLDAPRGTPSPHFGPFSWRRLEQIARPIAASLARRAGQILPHSARAPAT